MYTSIVEIFDWQKARDSKDYSFMPPPHLKKCKAYEILDRDIATPPPLGTRVILSHDDNSTNPYFLLEDGSGDEICISWFKLRPLDD